jgi:hypothetical protein
MLMLERPRRDRLGVTAAHDNPNLEVRAPGAKSYRTVINDNCEASHSFSTAEPRMTLIRHVNEHRFLLLLSDGETENTTA